MLNVDVDVYRFLPDVIDCKDMARRWGRPLDAHYSADVNITLLCARSGIFDWRDQSIIFSRRFRLDY
jgi:hypothetical protein